MAITPSHVCYSMENHGQQCSKCGNDDTATTMMGREWVCRSCWVANGGKVADAYFTTKRRF